jgi:hypothetical protein
MGLPRLHQAGLGRGGASGHAPAGSRRVVVEGPPGHLSGEHVGAGRCGGNRLAQVMADRWRLKATGRRIVTPGIGHGPVAG